MVDLLITNLQSSQLRKAIQAVCWYLGKEVVVQHQGLQGGVGRKVTRQERGEAVTCHYAGGVGGERVVGGGEGRVRGRRRGRGGRRGGEEGRGRGMRRGEGNEEREGGGGRGEGKEGWEEGRKGGGRGERWVEESCKGGKERKGREQY